MHRSTASTAWVHFASGVLAAVLSIQGCDRSPSSAGAAVSPAASFTSQEAAGVGADVVRRAEGGDAESQLAVGMAFLGGEGVAKDTAKGLRWLTLAAEHGSVDASRVLGITYREGKETPKDMQKAIDWFVRAANQGDRFSQTRLGDIYYPGGRDHAKHDAEARRIAEGNDDRARIMRVALQLAAESDDGVQKDIYQSIKWYGMAAQQGDPLAQARLGLIYFEGHGVTKDVAKAAEWYQKAAEWDYSTAQQALAYINCGLDGFPKDMTTAAKWFRKAARHGEIESQVALIDLYWRGDGVPKDFVRAYAWANIASANGVGTAGTARDALAARMTQSQIAEAQKLSAKFVPRVQGASKLGTDWDDGL